MQATTCEELLIYLDSKLRDYAVSDLCWSQNTHMPRSNVVSKVKNLSILSWGPRLVINKYDI